jgi:hypothetical protein
LLYQAGIKKTKKEFTLTIFILISNIRWYGRGKRSRGAVGGVEEEEVALNSVEDEEGAAGLCCGRLFRNRK